MARYITEKHAQEAFSTLLCDCLRDKKIPTYEDVADALLTCPTADVRENVHANWYGFFDGDEYRVYCSHCKDNWYEEDLWMGGNEFPKFCPNCGAIMDEGREND